MIALALALVVAQTQLQLNDRAEQHARNARASLVAAYAAARAEIPDDRRLARVQYLWDAMQQATCAYYSSVVAGGSIEPMVHLDCVASLSSVRAARLRALTADTRAGTIRPAQPVDARVDAQLNADYAKLANALDPSERPYLQRSEQAWIAYRDAACAMESGNCLTELERDRISDLKNSWMAEPLW